MTARLLLLAGLFAFAAVPAAAAPLPPERTSPSLVVIVWNGAAATIGLVDVNGGFTPRLTIDDPAGAGVRAAIDPFGRYAAVAVLSRRGAPQGDGAYLKVGDLATGATRTIDGRVDLQSRIVWSSDGLQVAARRQIATPDGAVDEVWAFDVNTGDSSLVERGTAGVGLHLIDWLAAAPRLLRVSSQFSSIGAAGESGTVVANGPVRDLAVSPDRRWLAFADYNEGPALGLLGGHGVVRTPAAGPFVQPVWRADAVLTVGGVPGGQRSVVPNVAVPTETIASRSGTVSLPIAWHGDWLAARTLTLTRTNIVTNERLELLHRDGRRVPLSLGGYAEALAWVGD